MLLDVTLQRDKAGKISDEVSSYSPDDKTKERLTQIKSLFTQAYTIRNKPYREFNDLSLVDRMNLDQMSFGQYVEPPSMDPAEAWRSRAFRPIVRNQIIKIAAHITASIIEPMVFAQNDADEEDRDAAGVMKDVMAWVNERSDYDKTFIASVIGALVNPCAYVYTENTKRYKTKRLKKSDGTIDVKRVLDEYLSGLKDYIVPCDEVWITNIYENDIQKQPAVIWRRVVDFSDAKARYGGNKNFDEYVRPGFQMIMGDDALFYYTHDQDQEQRLVEELIIWIPGEGLRLTQINGVLCCDPDEPNPRLDGLVPLAKFGFELIDEGRFFYYKSLAFKLCNDEALINTAYRMMEDGTYLQAMPPAVAFGVDAVSSAVMIPGAVTTFDNTDNPQASFQTIVGNNNLTALYNLTAKAEQSIDESGASPIMGGDAPKQNTTAYEISRLEQNARVLLGLFGKMVSLAVRDWGRLKVSDILQHMTVGEVSELAGGGGGMLKFRKFLLPDKVIDGKRKSKMIQFVSPDEMPQTGDEETILEASRKIADKEEQMGDKTKIIKVNPELFRRMKYMVVVKAEAVVPQSPAMQKALMLEEYALLRGNQLVNQEAITRDLALGAYERTSEDTDRYMMKPEELQQMAQAQAGVAQPDGLSGNFLDAAKGEGAATPDMSGAMKTLTNIK